jgi:hypothetical protein
MRLTGKVEIVVGGAKAPGLTLGSGRASALPHERAGIDQRFASWS